MQDYARDLKAKPSSQLGIHWVTPLDEEKAFMQTDKVGTCARAS